MTIHSTSHSTDDVNHADCTSLPSLKRANADPPLDFYNYFQHGIEFLISGTTNVVRKIILHTNVVSRFTSYVHAFLDSTTAWISFVSAV